MEETGGNRMVDSEEVKWTSVSLSEVIDRKKRIEASAFNIERRNNLKILNNSEYEIVNLSSEIFGYKDCFYGSRAKRNYVEKNDKTYGFLGSAEMLDINPNPVKYVSCNNPIVQELSLKENMILISRSGTVGNVTFVNKTLSNYIVSEHAIRLVVDKYQGYVYAYLKTDFCNSLMQAEKYGSVILEIEPSSIKKIPIPNATNEMKERIHNKIIESYALRDESNVLIEKATDMLVNELQMPELSELDKYNYSYDNSVNCFSVKLSELDSRLEGSYHLPIIEKIEKYMSRNAEIFNLGDGNISERIVLPGRGKRFYVEKGHGSTFVGGKEIGELDPSNKKYIALSQYSKKTQEEFKIDENIILVTRSGTVGKVSITPKHWKKWIVNDHIIRVFPKDKNIAGYIFAWLNTEYGKYLINRNIYGSVVLEITPEQLSNVKIPVLRNPNKVKEINDYILQANETRYRAYKLEQEAINLMNEEVLGLK